MIDEILRIPKEKIMKPLAKAMPDISPATVTVVACAVGVGAGLAAAGQQYGLALGLWAVNRLLDGLDGTLARLRNQQSDLGGYLDIVLDFVVYSAIPIGLAVGSPQPGAMLAALFLLASFYVNTATWMYLAALLEKRNQGAKARGELTTITMPGGLVEGLESLLFYTLFLLFPHWLSALFGVMAGLVVVTAAQRVVWAVRYLRTPLG